MPKQQSVVGVYENMAAPEDAVRTLDKAGFPIKRASIIG
jgi:hypothetical protein